MILNGTSITPTGTYPYTSIGPIDFSQINFTRTKQTDYYYGNVSGTQVLLSEVEQSYDPIAVFWTIAGIIITFFLTLAIFIKAIRRMGYK